MMSNEGISPKENKPKRVKDLGIRRGKVSRNNSVEKIRGGSGKRTTTVGKG